MNKLIPDITHITALRAVVLAGLKCVIVFWAIGSTLLINANASDNELNRYYPTRIDSPVKLDGLSVEPAWAGIEPLPVIMHVPVFGNDPTEKTEILLAYDDDFLYVAGRLYDSEPAKIQSPSMKRDAMGSRNDWLGVLIDSFNDKENALVFGTTPAGLRLDMVVFNDAVGDFPVQTSWNTFWDVATVRNEEGWFVEMRIPFSSLRFQDREGSVVMGLTLWRWIARKNEMIIFPAIPPKWGGWSNFKPSQAREMVFDGIYSRAPLYLTPYVLGGYGRSFELNDAETAYLRDDHPTRELGLDVKYGLTSNLTLDLTANTDFAQVEADDQQVNLTRYSLFFPEKRLFFQERSRIFEFNTGGQTCLFYSRRIGIEEEEGELIRIYGGARLVGRVGSWDVGMLDMQTAPFGELPSENFGVLRLRRQVINPNTYAGGIVTNRMGVDGSYNTAYGLDGIFRVKGDDYLVMNWAQTFENDRDNNPVSLVPARIRISWEKRSYAGFGYNLGFSRSGADYNPGIGFELHEDYTRYGNHLQYGWIPGERSPILRHQFRLNGFLFHRNTDNSIESAEIGPGWLGETKSGFFWMVFPKLNYESVTDTFSLSDDAEIPIGDYKFYGFEAVIESPGSRLFAASADLYVGDFYDGNRILLSVSPRWSVSSSLEFSGTYEFNRVIFPSRDQRYIAHIGRLRTLLMLSTKFSMTAFVQYNGATGAVISNARIRYNPSEGNDLYLVYNEGINTDRYREVPTLPAMFNRTILMKYSCTFSR